MTTKTLLLASFIFPDKLEWFVNYLNTKFNISKEKIFVFSNLDDPSKLIVTFKVSLLDGKKINLKKLFPNAIPIHKKGSAIYTINALNKLIELESGLLNGNIDYKSYKIDWEKYQNKFILTKGKSLLIYNIKQIFS